MRKLLCSSLLLASILGMIIDSSSVLAEDNQADETLSVLTDGTWSPSLASALERRSNFLRFGRAMDAVETGLISPKLGDVRGLNRRDYREFVRFGKRASNDNTDRLASRSFLRFGKRDFEPAIASDNRDVHKRSGLVGDVCGPRCLRQLLQSANAMKRSNDFLRFGKK